MHQEFLMSQCSTFNLHNFMVFIRSSPSTSFFFRFLWRALSLYLDNDNHLYFSLFFSFDLFQWLFYFLTISHTLVYASRSTRRPSEEYLDRNPAERDGDGKTISFNLQTPSLLSLSRILRLPEPNYFWNFIMASTPMFFQRLLTFLHIKFFFSMLASIFLYLPLYRLILQKTDAPTSGHTWQGLLALSVTMTSMRN